MLGGLRGEALDGLTAVAVGPVTVCVWVAKLPVVVTIAFTGALQYRS